MRWLEVRRHSLTKKGASRGHGSHLSAAGVALARAVGGQIGPVAYVVTGTPPRTLETALAMGYAVDEVVDWPPGYVAGVVEHHDQWRLPHPYLRYAELLAGGGELARVAQTHHGAWTDAVRAVPDGATALVISSGGAIEPALVACLPGADHAGWGAPFSHCDGARLSFVDGRFTGVELRRAPPAPRS
jgi:broad specificity phosphatase PhoE